MEGRIGVKTAVGTAKEWLLDAFAEEGAHSPRLEEIRLDDSGAVWKITISFIRGGATLAEALGVRAYKVVEIEDRTGKVVGLTHRSLPTGAAD